MSPTRRCDRGGATSPYTDMSDGGSSSTPPPDGYARVTVTERAGETTSRTTPTISRRPRRADDTIIARRPTYVFLGGNDNFNPANGHWPGELIAASRYDNRPANATTSICDRTSLR